jgi:Ca-activated chloride channel family protein
MKRHLAIAICLLLFHSVVQAQQFYLKGEVRDEAGTPLQNVMILHPSGYIFYSGSTGTFGILSSSPHDSLAFSLDGYQKQKTLLQAANYSTIVLRKAPKPARTFKLVSLTQNLRFESQQQWFTGEETYASTIENGMVPAERYPSTALTLNVDRASYSNIRRFLNSKSPVPPDAVRVEEMLNYFNFNYREPAAGKTFELETRLTTCPWNPANQLLFTTVRSRKIDLDSLPPTHLVFLIDASASMDAPTRMPLIKAGFRGLVNNLRAKDSVSIVIYGATVGVYLNTTSGAEKQRIINAIDSLETGGSTPGESGVKLAYSVARNHFIAHGNNRVILATDGDFNVGLRTEEDLENMIVEQRQSGVYLTCLGVGMGNYKDSKIQTLAQKGNGNFAYIDCYAEAEKVLMKEFMQTLYAVADDASLQLTFNPAAVKSYRLIGFDNKMGAIKDTVSVLEGGEVGSGFSLLAAFEIEPTHAAAATGSLASLSLQYRTPRDGRLEERFDAERNLIPYDRLEKPYQFAGAVILFGSLLRESHFMKDQNWNDVSALALKSVDVSDASQKDFPALVEKAKSIYGGRKKKKFSY